MAIIFRLLTLGLFLYCSNHAIAENCVEEGNLDMQKELLLLRIDGGKELLQKDIELQGKRIDDVNKRIDDYVIGLGHAVDRFGILITVILTSFGGITFISVVKKAEREAKDTAKTVMDEELVKVRDEVQKAFQDISHLAGLTENASAGLEALRLKTLELQRELDSRK